MNTDEIIEQIDELIGNITSLTHIPQEIRMDFKIRLEDIQDELEEQNIKYRDCEIEDDYENEDEI